MLDEYRRLLSEAVVTQLLSWLSERRQDVSVARHEDGYDVLYVADTNNNLIRRVDVYPPSHPMGGPITTTVAGTGLFGAIDGPALQATFVRPSALAVSLVLSPTVTNPDQRAGGRLPPLACELIGM